MKKRDPRLNAYRPDLADSRLRGEIDAAAFVDGRIMRMSEPLVPVHRAPRFAAMQLTQALLGETVRVFDVSDGWAWLQLARDGYVGYCPAGALSETVIEPTHRVAVPSTFMYPQPDLKTQPAVVVTLNARVTVVGGGEKFAQLSNGRFIFARHLKPLGENETDFVAVAEMFRHVPYYWGGKSVHGLDCSGLVQLSLEACGIAAPRDSDMQEEDLGRAIPQNDLDGLRRGDLVFWEGHVGIMTDRETLLHANGHHMAVACEPLRQAVARIAATGSPVLRIRRFQ